MALRFFGTGAEARFLVVLLSRIARVGRSFAQAHIIPPLFVRILSVFFRGSCPGNTGKTWAEVPLLGFLGGSRLGLDLLGQSLSVNFLGRVGYGSCLGLDALSFAPSWAFAASLASVALRLAADDCSARLAATASRARRAASSFALAAWSFVSLFSTAWC